MTKVEQIKAEIERRIKMYKRVDCLIDVNRIDEDESLLDFINSLEEEPQIPYQKDVASYIAYFESYVQDDIKSNVTKQEEQTSDKVLDIEIPFGAKDSELIEASYHIPDGFHAEIKGNEVIIKKGEESVSDIWHDSNKEQPSIGATVAVWDGVYGDILTYVVKVSPNRKWAYMEDLLRLENKEPVSEDFKEFEQQYMKENEGEIVNVYDRHAGLVDGAEWQKEQMMKVAIDGFISDDATGKFLHFDTLGFNMAGLKFQDGDKVKVIIVKDET